MSDDHVPTSNELAAQRTDLAGQRTHLADERTGLAVTRTMLALDRTLMAWVRTGTSLISFGFTLYKFLQAMTAEKGAQDTERMLGPRGISLVLIALGVGGLTLALIEYQRQTRSMRKRYSAYGPFHSSIAAGVATAVAGLGICGFVLVFLRQ